MEKHGWERFGENHTDTILGGYMEGAWLTKYNGTYYMQYAAPGTEFNVYADGVYTAKHPLGPYTYAPNNPISYKPGGFMNGAGHGSTVIGPGNNYWHFGSMSLSATVNWERRLCMFPAFFDKDGLMYCDTRFGDYPHYAPAEAGKQGDFTGWMLLSYKKPVKASSYTGEFAPEYIRDENCKTFWLAKTKSDREWVEIDLQQPGTVYAVQVNYHDYQSNLYRRIPNLWHRYLIEGSPDGKEWVILADRTNSFKDTPNDYVQVDTPSRVRYIRYKNIEVPTPHLAISGLRIFGTGEGKRPVPVKKFQVERQADQRDALLTWEPVKGAQGYNIRWGIAPDKLYTSWLVYEENELYIRSLTVGLEYFFAIEAFNENGVSPLSPIQPTGKQ